MSNLPLISVIVPVYNIEKYIGRCVESICQQQYKNLEIILVDDGSEDSSGQICDKYAMTDSRIKVIHQKNKGLSAARNIGIDESKGDLIGFVDGDDCIHPEMYSRLYDDVCRYNVRLAFCQPNMCQNQIVTPSSLNGLTKCKTSEEVIEECLREIKWFSACTKLYVKELFEDIRFPIWRTNEDFPTILRIFDRCDKIAINYNNLYNYCLRPGSIARSFFNEHKFDAIYNAEEVMTLMEENHPRLRHYAEKILLSSCLGLLVEVYKLEGNNYIMQQKKLEGILSKHVVLGLKNRDLTIKQKVLLVLGAISPKCLKFISKYK